MAQAVCPSKCIGAVKENDLWPEVMCHGFAHWQRGFKAYYPTARRPYEIRMGSVDARAK